MSQHDFIRRVDHGSQQLVLLRSVYVGRPYDYIVYPYLAADSARRGKNAEALGIVEHLPRKQAAVRAAAIRDLS